MVTLRGHFRPDQPRQAGLTQYLSELRGAQFVAFVRAGAFLQSFQQHLLLRKKVCNGCQRPHSFDGSLMRTLPGPFPATDDFGFSP
jgi:hypothetical protein